MMGLAEFLQNKIDFFSAFIPSIPVLHRSITPFVMKMLSKIIKILISTCFTIYETVRPYDAYS